MLIVAAVAALAVLLVFVLVMWSNNRPNEEIDGPHEEGAAAAVSGLAHL